MTRQLDHWRGWRFEHLPDGSHRVTTPNGHVRHYSQETAAEEAVNLILAARNGNLKAEEQLALWRRVIGEERYQQAEQILDWIGADDPAELFEVRRPREVPA